MVSYCLVLFEGLIDVYSYEMDMNDDISVSFAADLHF